MTSRPPLARLLALLLALAAAAPAAAQLDLPDRPSDRAPRRRAPRAGLDLPDAPAAEPKPPRETEAEPAPGPAETPAPVYPPDAAGAILSRLQPVRDTGDARVNAAVTELVALGEAGLRASRAALDSDHGPTLVAALRTVLSGGEPEDRTRAVALLSGRMPARAAVPLLLAFVELDPVGASPELLVQLLRHPQGSVRSAVARLLAERVGPDEVPSLAALLADEEDDTRLHAVEVLSRAPPELVTDALLSALGDPSARVASTAASALSLSTDGRVPDELRALATDKTAGRRAAAYATLAIVEREDVLGVAILGDEDVDGLLSCLALESELASGAAACALAGIGFRSATVGDAGWLDLLVPHHLVRAVSAVRYHKDFTSIQEPAHRRLVLLAGTDFGANGPAWQTWWREAAPSFRARRAALAVTPATVAALGVTVLDPRRDESFRIAGPDAPPIHVEAVPIEEFRITREECQGLLRVLEREEALTATRLPTVNARKSGAPGRELVVAAGARAKRFVLASPRGEPWAERVVEMARGQRDANRWQRWFAGEAGSPAWLEEQRYWLETTAGAARARRLKEMILAALPEAGSTRRAQGLATLAATEDAPGVWNATDVRPLIALLARQAHPGLEVERLVALATRAARADAGPVGEAPSVRAVDGGAPIDGRLADELVSTLAARLDVAAARRIAEVLGALPAERVRPMTLDPRAPVRAGAALALAELDDDAVPALLGALLEDPDTAVEAAAVEALGARGCEGAVDAILDRAEPDHRRAEHPLDPPEARRAVRVAALGAVARSDDPRALSALLTALSDADDGVRRAAAEGVAALRDPAALPILVSMLARGPSDVVFRPAQEGLRALGPAAHTELLRVVNRREPGLSREAALLLAEAGVARAAAPMLALLTETPGDARLAWELAVLTCVDFRREDDPAGAWWEWWDTVVHDDSISWLRAAGERAGLRAPERAAFEGAGTRDAAGFLFDLAAGDAPHVAERARRELSARLGRSVGVAAGAPEDVVEARARLLDEGWPRRE